jgi:DNA-binding CsgD family transcriptional regulator
MAKSDNSRQIEGLSIEQQNAIDLLIQGKSDREVGEACGVARQTVTSWRNNHAEFVAELNRRRLDVWAAQTDRLRALVSSAVDVLELDLTSEDARLRQAAAVHILRAVGLYGMNLLPVGPTSAEAAAVELLLNSMR